MPARDPIALAGGRAIRSRRHWQRPFARPRPSRTTLAITRWPGAGPLGISSWDPGARLARDATRRARLTYLPSRLWLIGLGNLGQAYAWLLAWLPYRDPGEVELVLQDFDRIAVSNDSTSLLSSLEDVGARRRVSWPSGWKGAASTRSSKSGDLANGRDGPSTQPRGRVVRRGQRARPHGPRERPGSVSLVEAGLGAGPQAFRNMALHTFPATRSAARNLVRVQLEMRHPTCPRYLHTQRFENVWC